MTIANPILTLMNATFFGASIAAAGFYWAEGASTRWPLTVAAINFAAIVIALV